MKGGAKSTFSASPEGPVIRRIAIVGAGRAGLLTALTLRQRLPEIEIEVVRCANETGDFLPFGEGSPESIPSWLHGELQLDPATFHREVHPTYQIGSRFHWGPRPRFHFSFALEQLSAFCPALSQPKGFYCRDEFDFTDRQGALMAHEKAFERGMHGFPEIAGAFGYQWENARFVAHLESQLADRGIKLNDEPFREAQTGGAGIEFLRLNSGDRVTADLFVDATGCTSLLLGKTLGEPRLSFASSSPCDRAFLGTEPRNDQPMRAFTTIETMGAGWTWQTEHENVIARGMAYSTAHCSEDEAERDLAARFPAVSEWRPAELDQGRFRQSWNGNVVAVGNAAGFVAPLQSTALGILHDGARRLADAICDADATLYEPIIELYNREMADTWDEIRRITAVPHRFNDRLDSSFWKDCTSGIDLAGAEALVEHYAEFGPALHGSRHLVPGDHPWGLEVYLVWLVGSRAMTRLDCRPGQDEARTWEGFLKALRKMANEAASQEEALQLLHEHLGSKAFGS